MKPILLYSTWLLSIALTLTNISHAQTSKKAYLEKHETTGTQEIGYKSSVTKAIDGHIYICGATLNSEGNYDMILTKFTAQNDEVWTRTFGGIFNGNDFASDLIEDSNGDIVITGAEQISSIDYDAVTIKYNSSGVEQWIKKYSGDSNLIDGGVSIKTDNASNLYVCGGTSTLLTQIDFLVMKYDSDGNEQWITT